MRANTEILRHWAEEISTDWEQLRSWSERAFTKEKIAEMSVLLSTLTLWAVLLFLLYKQVHNYTVFQANNNPNEVKEDQKMRQTRTQGGTMAIDFSFILYTSLLVYILLGTIATYAAYRILKRLVLGHKVLWGARHVNRALRGSARRAAMSPAPHRI